MTPISKHWLSLAAGAALTAIMAGPAMAAPITIDDFDDPGGSTLSQNTVGTSTGIQTGGGAMLGNERDMILTVTSDTDGAGINEAQFVVNDGGSSLGNYTNDADVESTLELQYDGEDGSTALDATGLGGIDLTMGGTNDGFALEIEFSDLPVETTITVYSDETNWSFIDVQTPGLIFSGAETFFVDFDDFVVGGGSGANFASAGAVTFLFDGPPGLDFRFDFIAAVEEIPEPANPLLMGLGVLGLGLMGRIRAKKRQRTEA